MADIIDSASEIEELQRNTAIKMRRLNHQAISATHCCECGDPIDERRRLAVQGCRTCASCQEDLELISKQRGSKLAIFSCSAMILSLASS
ncbi:TraR/DksA family transcriptional regulator [Escherichia sp. HC-CC]